MHPKNENRYMSWNMHADVRMRTSATQGGGGGEEEEDEEEEEGSAALSLNVFTKSALQLTVTKTSLSIFNELWQVGVMAGCHTTHMHTQCQMEIDRHTHMCVCACACTYACTHVHAHTHTHTHTHRGNTWHFLPPLPLSSCRPTQGRECLRRWTLQRPSTQPSP